MTETAPRPIPRRRRLGSQEAAHLVSCLAPSLEGRHVDRVWRPTERTLLLRLSGRDKRRLWIDVSVAWPYLTLTDSWPATPTRPDQTTLRFRNTLEGCRIIALRLDGSRTLTLSLAHRETERSLHVQLAGRYPNVSVTHEEPSQQVRLVPSLPATDPGSPPLPEGAAPYADLDPAAWLARWSHEARTLTQQMTVAAEQQGIDSALRALAKRLARRRKAIRRDLDRAEDAVGYRRDGELLKAALHLLGGARGREEVTVTDFYAPEPGPVQVAVDPRRTPQEQMTHLFKQHRRLSTARAAIAERLSETEARVATVARLRASAQALDLSDVEAARAVLKGLEEEARGLGLTRKRGGRSKRRAAPPRAAPYHRYVAQDGSEILVGRGAKHNDTLTFRVARGWDIWMHAKDAPGAHVILRTPKGREAHPEALLDAAQLAADHSRLKEDGVITILWTRRKHVRKAPGAKAGEVYVSEGRTLSVRPERKRRERLKMSRREPAG